MRSLNPLLIYRVTNHSDFPEAVQVLTLKVYFPGKPLVSGKPGWSVIISHLRSLVSNMHKYIFKLELYVSQSYMAKAQNVLCKSLYLPSCISDLSSPFCLPKEEAKLYSQGRVEVGEKWVSDLRRDQLWNRLCDGNTWKSMKIIKGLQIGSKGPFDARQHDLEMDQLCKILWCLLSAGKPRDTSSFFPIRCLEGLQKKVNIVIEISPKRTTAFKSRTRGKFIGKLWVYLWNKLICGGLISKSPLHFANWPQMQGPYIDTYAKVGPIHTKLLIFAF